MDTSSSIDQSTFSNKPSKKQRSIYKKIRTYTLRMTFVSIVSPILALASAYLLFTYGTFHGVLVRLDNGTAQSTAALPHKVASMWSSDTGTLWLNDADNNFWMLQDSEWKLLPEIPASFGFNIVGSVFAHALNNELWVAQLNSWARFDGDKWKVVPFPPTLKNGFAQRLQAVGTEIYLMSWEGKLWRFDGSQWAEESLTGLPAVNDVEPHFQPSMTSSLSGELLVLFDGTWRRENGIWTKIGAEPAGKDMALLGRSKSGFWIEREGKVTRYKFNGNLVERAQEISLKSDSAASGDGTFLLPISTYAEKLWLVSESKLFTIDQEDKQSEVNLGVSLRNGNHSSYGVSSDGSIWAISRGTNSPENLLLLIPLTLFLLPGALRFLCNVSPHWGRKLGLLYDLRDQDSPDTSVQPIMNGRPGLAKTARLKTTVFQHAVVLGFAYLGFKLGVPLLAVLILIPMLSTLFIVLPILTVSAAIKRGEYETAIRRAEVLLHLGLSPDVHIGDELLLFAGHFEEAEACIRRNANEEHIPTRRGLASIRHAKALFALGKLAEAKRVAARGHELCPVSIDGACVLAWMHLELGEEPQAALELIDKAAALQRKSLLLRMLEPDEATTILAIRAWALAANDKRDEAQRTLAEVFRKVKKANVPDYSRQLYFVARTCEKLGDRNGAYENLRLAADADHGGGAGKIASKALEVLRRNRTS